MKYNIKNGYLGGEDEKFKGKMFCPFSDLSYLCGENCPHFDYQKDRPSFGRSVEITCGGRTRIIPIETEVKDEIKTK